MDEMNNMNEVTTEETSKEVAPVETNNEVNAEANSDFNSWIGVGVAAVVLVAGGIAAAKAKHKGKAQTEKGEKTKKPKTHFKWQLPLVRVKDEPDVINDVEHKDVSDEETNED